MRSRVAITPCAATRRKPCGHIAAGLTADQVRGAVPGACGRLQSGDRRRAAGNECPREPLRPVSACSPRPVAIALRVPFEQARIISVLFRLNPPRFGCFLLTCTRHKRNSEVGMRAFDSPECRRASAPHAARRTVDGPLPGSGEAKLNAHHRDVQTCAVRSLARKRRRRSGQLRSVFRAGPRHVYLQKRVRSGEVIAWSGIARDGLLRRPFVGRAFLSAAIYKEFSQ